MQPINDKQFSQKWQFRPKNESFKIFSESQDVLDIIYITEFVLFSPKKAVEEVFVIWWEENYEIFLARNSD